MAKIVQSLTRASAEYEEDVAQSLVRDLDAVLEKLNTTHHTPPNTPNTCLLYTSPSPRDRTRSRMPSSA